jgi:hypothetical protein
MSNQNNDFNFENFSVRAIRYIDSLRSFGKSGTKPNESRINAFYRALGLPTVIPENERDWIDGKTDEFNNGNINNLNFISYKADLDERIGLFDRKATNEEINNFLDLNRQNIKSSLSKNESNYRYRGVLFPMIVDGRINIFPQSRRVGGAFMSNRDLKHEMIKYKKPFIESILYFKLKGENSIDSSKQVNTSAAFQNIALGDLSNNASIRLRKTLYTVSHTFERTVQKINYLRGLSGKVVIPNVPNIAQQNLSMQSIDEQIGLLDYRINQQTIKESFQNSVLSLFQFDDNINLDTRNLQGEGLVDLFLEMLVPQNRTKKQRRNLNIQQDKVHLEIKEIFRSMDLMFGTFSGISGIDILVTIIALFELDSTYLTGLLNKKSQDRLKDIKGQNLPAVTNAKGLSESINKLQTEITKIFDELSGYIKTIKHEDKVRNRYSEGEQ